MRLASVVPCFSGFAHQDLAMGGGSRVLNCCRVGFLQGAMWRRSAGDRGTEGARTVLSPCCHMLRHIHSALCVCVPACCSCQSLGHLVARARARQAAQCGKVAFAGTCSKRRGTMHGEAVSGEGPGLVAARADRCKDPALCMSCAHTLNCWRRAPGLCAGCMRQALTQNSLSAVPVRQT